MEKVYAIFLADTYGNFDWVYIFPKPFYQDKQEAETIMEKLIQEEQLNKSQIKIKQLWKVTDKN